LGLYGTRPEALAGPVVPVKFAEKKERLPLDASLVVSTDGPDEVGVFAVRVGELARAPRGEKLAEVYANVIPALVGESGKVFFKLDDVEQIAGRVTVKHDPTRPRPNSSVMLSLGMVRMAKDFDWVKQLKAWTTDWAEHAHGGATYSSAMLTAPFLGFKATPFWFYLPDGRTMVLESEANIKTLIDARGTPAAPAWAHDWKAVEGGTLAVVLPDVKGKLAKMLPGEKLESDLAESMVKPVAAIRAKARRAAIGVEFGEGCSVTVRLACATGADATDVEAGCQALARLAKAALDDDDRDPEDAVDKAGHRLSVELVNGIEFGKSVDHVVEVRMRARTGVADLLKAFHATAGGK
jgi:hypothetical protein